MFIGTLSVWQWLFSLMPLWSSNDLVYGMTAKRANQCLNESGNNSRDVALVLILCLERFQNHTSPFFLIGNNFSLVSPIRVWGHPQPRGCHHIPSAKDDADGDQSQWCRKLYLPECPVRAWGKEGALGNDILRLLQLRICSLLWSGTSLWARCSAFSCSVYQLFCSFVPFC